MSDSPFVIEVNAENFQRVVIEGSMERPVLVDFWADWCNPCKILMPILASLADAYQGKFILAKLNTEEQRELAAQYGIRSLPTVKLFRNGQPLDEFMGALPEREIRTFLDRHIPRESDLILAQAEQLLQQGDSEGAGELMLKANQMDPGNPRVLLALGRYLTGQGRLDDAQALLNALPAEERESPEVIALLTRIEFDQTCADAPAVEELKKMLEADPDDSKARFQLANHKVINNDLEGALEQFLILIQKDRQYNDDAGRKGMLKVFEMLGGEGELVKRYRNRMFNILH